LETDRVNQVWVSDITYIRVNGHWNYLTLITDLFSRRIVGYAFSNLWSLSLPILIPAFLISGLRI
jgi:putative transposase